MVFSGVTFLFWFLPLVLAAYAVVPDRARNLVLLLASLVFYVWASGWLVVVLGAAIGVDYALGIAGGRALHSGRQRRIRVVVTISVLVNIGLLVWFKYATWLVELADDAGLSTGAAPDITLPVGISFFTLQSISYTIALVRGRCEPVVNPVDHALRLAFFPKLIAGPLVVPEEFDDQIRRRTFTGQGVGEGALRFAHGLVKKVVVADAIAPAADVVFSSDPADLTTAAAWVGVVAFTLQIYFDFSGYADMAIGLGLMFGFRLPENFVRPYSALSVTDFWRRWQITLFEWFRDRVYVPLGGSEPQSNVRAVRNLFIFSLLVGLWYGGAWTFVAWGAYNGFWLAGERLIGARHIRGEGIVRDTLRRARTLLTVMVGWVFFRAGSVSDALELLEVMFTPSELDLTLVDRALTTRASILLVLAAVVVLFPRRLVVGPTLLRSPSTTARFIRPALMLCLFPAALLLAAGGAAGPFVLSGL